MDYNGRTFRNEAVDLDDNTFVGCTFEDVTFNYAGGSAVITECHFASPPIWMLKGNLATGLEMLRKFSHDGGPKYVKATVDGLAAIIRKKDPPKTFTIG